MVEIDAAAAERACPRCASSERSSWGTTRTRARRWRCRTCEKTWSGRTGSPVTNLSHNASFHFCEKITPSNRGIKQLCPSDGGAPQQRCYRRIQGDIGLI
ncbi:IS1/IS1595 family N-terminal zinc-binding domain-containing protein [Poseidonocella pacifica]|uniref:IS1/IS1595 family N-terminal zinc-binding domain-containing protein n=1 Tax=Poseidonocella pacifica TaxID=871651 RepID=UPI003CCB9F34